MRFEFSAHSRICICKHNTVRSMRRDTITYRLLCTYNHACIMCPPHRTQACFQLFVIILLDDFQQITALREKRNDEGMNDLFQMFRGVWQWSTLLLTLLGTRLLFVVAQCGSFAQDRQEKEEKQDKLALYKVTLRTYWSRARFPRHYPEWKPPAQFGKLIGECLNDSLSFFPNSYKVWSESSQQKKTVKFNEIFRFSESREIHCFLGS